MSNCQSKANHSHSNPLRQVTDLVRRRFRTMPHSIKAKAFVPEPFEGIRHISSDDEVVSYIKSIPVDKLIVLYYSLPWCGSCQKMNPNVEALAEKYGEVAFLQVNADKCPVTTKKYHITKVPVFLLFSNRVKLDRVEGASPSELESKIRRNLADIRFQAQGLIPQTQALAPIPQPSRMIDITPFMDRSQCRCVNDLTPTPFTSFLEGKKLISGKGVGRMILVYAFKEKMLISGFKIKAAVFSAPKVLRFFVNLHKVLDFAVVSQMSSTQEIVLSEEDVSGERMIELKNGGLVGVQNVQIYIPENMTKNRKTEIESLIMMGMPVSASSFANTVESTKTIRQSASDIEMEKAISEYTVRAPSNVVQLPGNSKKKHHDH